MARPRKNRIGEYAGLLGDELRHHISKDLEKSLAESLAVFQEEIAKLTAEVRALSRRVEALSKRPRSGRAKVGKWVPGGPGRPPKDATERIHAFAEKQRTNRTKKPRRANARGARNAPGTSKE